jgi:hypothetical protein
MWNTYRESKAYIDLVECKKAQNKVVTAYRKAKKKFGKKKLAWDVKKS